MTGYQLLLAAPEIPRHPTTPMPFVPEVIFTVFLGIPVVVMVFFAIRHLMTGRGPLLLYCLIGGGIACMFEPIVDTLGMCYIRQEAATTTFSSFGRDFPLFINFVYVWYVGGLAYLAYRIFSNGVTRKAVFQLYLIDVFINVWLESPGVLMGAYEYYGPQPLNFWGLPLWWVCVNPLMPLTAGALIYRMSPMLPGWRLVAVVAFIPMADGIGNGATAWPVWTALNRNSSLLVSHLAWGVTLGLALIFVWVLSYVVGRPDDGVLIKSKVGILRAAVFGIHEKTKVPTTV